MATSLEVRGLTVELPTPGGWGRPVNDVSFTLGEGETLGIVGESGSGKTMLSLALMGLEPHGARHSGEAWLNLRGGVGSGNDNDSGGKNGGASSAAQTGTQSDGRAGRENLLGISQNKLRELRARGFVRFGEAGAAISAPAFGRIAAAGDDRDGFGRGAGRADRG